MSYGILVLLVVALLTGVAIIAGVSDQLVVVAILGAVGIYFARKR